MMRTMWRPMKTVTSVFQRPARSTKMGAVTRSRKLLRPRLRSSLLNNDFLMNNSGLFDQLGQVLSSLIMERDLFIDSALGQFRRSIYFHQYVLFLEARHGIFQEKFHVNVHPDGYDELSP